MIMKPFYLKSITIYEQCDKALMKTLRPRKYKLSERLPFDMYGENISVCAIVGENGAGKSSLLDILYRIINNLSYLVIGNNSSRNAADELYYVKGLYASVEYALNGKDCQLLCRGDFLGMQCGETRWYTSKAYISEEYFEEQGFEYKDKIKKEEQQEILQDCFFTIATNYSLQAFNSNDYRLENLLRFDSFPSYPFANGNWMDSIFNKNDGYLVPLTLNPYRNHGKFDMNGESERVEDRLTTLLMQFKSESQELIPGYEVSDISYEFDEQALVQKYWRYRPDHNITITIKSPLDLYTAAEIAARGKVDTYLKIILYAYGVTYKNDKKEYDAACIYLGYKTLVIARNYPSYKEYAHLGDPWKLFASVNNKKKQQLMDLVHAIVQDASHITTKIDQTRFFLQNYNRAGKNLFKKKFTLEEYLQVTKGQPFHTRIDGLTGMLPPPIFSNSTTLRSTNTKNNESNKPIPYPHLSSGERQFLSMMSTLTYHIKNIESVSLDRVHYDNINIILDEVEICFHPEYQRLLVERLVTVIKQLELNRDCAFNIILTTHSPFILSDIVPDNILYLKKGLPYPIKKVDMQPFAANVNDILRRGFFLKNGFVGEHAKNQIFSLVKFLKSRKKKDGIWDDESAERFIAMIGEPLLQDTLLALKKEHETHRNKRSNQRVGE